MLKITNPKFISFLGGSILSVRLLPSAIDILFLLDSGVSLQKITLLKSIFSFCSFLFLIPAGIISDQISRKLAIVCGGVCFIIYYPFFINAPHIGSLIISQIFLALGFSLTATLQSWINDATNSYVTEEKKHTARSNGMLTVQIQGFISACSGFVGAIVVSKFNISYTSLFAFTCLLISLITFCFLFVSDVKKFKEEKFEYNFNVIFNAFKNHNTFVCLFSKILIFIALQPLFFYWQPYLRKSLVPGDMNPTIIMGIYFLFFNLTISFFNFVYRQYFLKKHFIKTQIISILISSISFFFLAYASTQHFIISIFFLCLCGGFISIISINNEYDLLSSIPKSVSATVSSFGTLLGRGSCAIYLFSLSSYINNEFFQIAFYVSSLAIISLFVIKFFFFLKKWS